VGETGSPPRSEGRQLESGRADPDYAFVLPSLLRIALALDDPSLAQRFTTDQRTPRARASVPRPSLA
jgi:hypothetical protein